MEKVQHTKYEGNFVGIFLRKLHHRSGKAADRQQEERVATIKTKAIVTTDDDIFNSIFKHCKSSFTSAFSYKSGRRKFCSHLYIVRSKAKTTVIYAGEWTNKNCTKTKVSVRCKWSNINNRIGASSTNKNTNCGSLKLRHDSMRNAPFHHQLSQLLNKSWQHTTVSMYLDSLWRLYKWLSVIRAGVCVCVHLRSGWCDYSWESVLLCLLCRDGARLIIVFSCDLMCQFPHDPWAKCKSSIYT